MTQPPKPLGAANLLAIICKELGIEPRSTNALTPDAKESIKRVLLHIGADRPPLLAEPQDDAPADTISGPPPLLSLDSESSVRAESKEKGSAGGLADEFETLDVSLRELLAAIDREQTSGTDAVRASLVIAMQCVNVARNKRILAPSDVKPKAGLMEDAASQVSALQSTLKQVEDKHARLPSKLTRLEREAKALWARSAGFSDFETRIQNQEERLKEAQLLIDYLTNSMSEIAKWAESEAVALRRENAERAQEPSMDQHVKMAAGIPKAEIQSESSYSFRLCDSRYMILREKNAAEEEISSLNPALLGLIKETVSANEKKASFGDLEIEVYRDRDRRTYINVVRRIVGFPEMQNMLLVKAMRKEVAEGSVIFFMTCGGNLYVDGAGGESPSDAFKKMIEFLGGSRWMLKDLGMVRKGHRLLARHEYEVSLRAGTGDTAGLQDLVANLLRVKDKSVINII